MTKPSDWSRSEIRRLADTITVGVRTIDWQPQVEGTDMHPVSRPTGALRVRPVS